MAEIRTESAQTLKKALAFLSADMAREPLTVEGLHLYVNAILNRYLAEYQQTPDRFFENSEKIRTEMQAYLDLMLYGICQKEQL